MKHKIIFVREDADNAQELVKSLNEGWVIISAVAQHCKGDGLYITSPVIYVLKDVR